MVRMNEEWFEDNGDPNEVTVNLYIVEGADERCGVVARNEAVAIDMVDGASSATWADGPWSVTPAEMDDLYELISQQMACEKRKPKYKKRSGKSR